MPLCSPVESFISQALQYTLALNFPPSHSSQPTSVLPHSPQLVVRLQRSSMPMYNLANQDFLTDHTTLSSHEEPISDLFNTELFLWDDHTFYDAIARAHDSKAGCHLADACLPEQAALPEYAWAQRLGVEHYKQSLRDQVGVEPWKTNALPIPGFSDLMEDVISSEDDVPWDDYSADISSDVSSISYGPSTPPSRELPLPSTSQPVVQPHPQNTSFTVAVSPHHSSCQVPSLPAWARRDYLSSDPSSSSSPAPPPSYSRAQSSRAPSRATDSDEDYSEPSSRIARSRTRKERKSTSKPYARKTPAGSGIIPPVAGLAFTPVPSASTDSSSDPTYSSSSSSSSRVPISPPDAHGNYPCNQPGCMQICKSAGDLRRHLQSLAHREPEFPCDRCGRNFTRVDALKRHRLKVKRCDKVVHATSIQSA